MVKSDWVNMPEKHKGKIVLHTYWYFLRSNTSQNFPDLRCILHYYIIYQHLHLPNQE